MCKRSGFICLCVLTFGCGQFPAATGERASIGIQGVATQTIPIGNSAQMDAAAKPVPLPRPSFAELEAKTPSRLRTGTQAPAPRPDALEIPSRMADPERGGDGKKFQVVNETLASFPYNVTGKLLSDFGSCSGSVIGPHLVLTAGHCVHAGGTGGPNYSNLRFQPGYPINGNWYLASEVFVHREWVKSGAFQFDYSFIYFASPMPVTYYWGIISNVDWGVSYPCSPSQTGCYRAGVFSFGYPAAAPFDGKSQFYDPVQHSCWICGTGNLVFKIVGMDYWDLAPGASGGPWLNTMPRGGVLFPEPVVPAGYGKYAVSGLNSFMPHENAGEIWSPQFTDAPDDIQALYREVVQNHPR